MAVAVLGLILVNAAIGIVVNLICIKITGTEHEHVNLGLLLILSLSWEIWFFLPNIRTFTQAVLFDLKRGKKPINHCCVG